jgi:hypothetical protein
MLLWSEFEQKVSFHYNAQNGNVFFILKLISTMAKKKDYAIYGHSDPDLGRNTSFSWDTHIQNLMILEQVVTSRTGFFLIWPYHLTWRSQWSDFNVRHTVYTSCTSWQSLMLGMIAFKLWSGHEVDRRTDMIATP